MSALWPVQVAVYTALTNHAPLMAAVEGVYDGEAAQEAAFPYIVVGSATEAPVGVFGGAMWSDTLVIHVWSDYGGRREALEILTLIDAALASPLAIDGHTTARLKREFAEVLIDLDGSRHVPARYRVTTREVA